MVRDCNGGAPLLHSHLAASGLTALRTVSQVEGSDSQLPMVAKRSSILRWGRTLFAVMLEIANVTYVIIIVLWIPYVNAMLRGILLDT